MIIELITAQVLVLQLHRLLVRGLGPIIGASTLRTMLRNAQQNINTSNVSGTDACVLRANARR